MCQKRLSINMVSTGAVEVSDSADFTAAQNPVHLPGRSNVN